MGSRQTAIFDNRYAHNKSPEDPSGLFIIFC